MTPDDASTDPPPGEEWEALPGEPEPEPAPEPERQRTIELPRWQVVTGLVVIAVLLIVSIAAGALALTAPSEDDGGDKLAVTITDDFVRNEPDGLGVADSGQTWEENQGGWSVSNFGAKVADVDGRLDSIATVDLEDTDGLLRVTLSPVAEGAGVVLRYRNPSDYVAVEAEPAFGTWSISQVARGERRDLGQLGLSRARDQTTIEIRLRGSSIDFYVEGVYRTTVTHDANPDATRFGLFSTADAGEAMWNFFEARNASAISGGELPQQD